jgi:outer membrane protein assembly factor BamB
MYCLDALFGKLLWEFAAKDAIWSSPAVVDDRVVFGSYDSHLYVLSTAGHELSRIRLQGRILSSPCIVAGNIYIGTAEGMFYCLS